MHAIKENIYDIIVLIVQVINLLITQIKLMLLINCQINVIKLIGSLFTFQVVKLLITQIKLMLLMQLNHLNEHIQVSSFKL